MGRVRTVQELRLLLPKFIPIGSQANVLPQGCAQCTYQWWLHLERNACPNLNLPTGSYSLHRPPNEPGEYRWRNP